ncbi:Non-canonical purine NTP pyrophosphatase [Candidatus Izimaplasma bacterium HR1]|jgi:XTP/dITP diphosphohydrolase|uniref:RdgB/HAM1 family non-canonical purine NTP pyrophosphatase n=1 Tax=Candidatus Izimoplasma sp. HR1 TaxID=1541959 RepID=UPI0004F67B41|nr:Non-canonical purine NTP pyrophosphatase [Candidatus Izimaplasma bacterium HR1]
MKEILIATKNKHKIIEMKKMLEHLGYKVLTLFDYEELPEIIEDKDTFKGNAKKKAETLSNYLNKDVLADDSGLEVFALNNEPGVYSARYSGEDVTYADNNKLLLSNMENIDNRGARFVTTICLYRINQEPVYFEDYLYGEIAYKYQGDNGFGYDPIFIPSGDTRHLAEYSLDEKNVISHRGKCVQKLISYLKLGE